MHCVIGWQLKRKGLFALRIQVDTVRMLSDPAFGTKELLRRLDDRASIPSRPTMGTIFIEVAILIRKNNYTIAEDDNQIGKLFSRSTIQIRMTPQTQKAVLTELGKVSLRVCHT